MKKILTIAGGLLSAVTVGAGVASADIGAQDVQQMISDRLTPELGVAPDSVVCPSGLVADVGSTVTCQVTAGGETHPVTVSVAAVDPNGQMSLAVQVAR